MKQSFDRRIILSNLLSIRRSTRVVCRGALHFASYFYNVGHAKVVASYGGQQQVEKVFRGLKDGNWLNWDPRYHWTDSKIRVHAFYCMLGISLLNYLHAQMQKVCPRITVEQLKDELQDIKQYVLLYPPQGDKGPYRTVTVQEKLTLTQALLAQAIGLEALTLKKSR